MSRGKRRRATTLEDVQSIHPTPMQEVEAQQRAGLPIICCDCPKVLTAEEVQYYGSRCEACERVWHDGFNGREEDDQQEANTMTSETKPASQTIYIKEPARVRAPAVDMPPSFGAGTAKESGDDIERRFVEMASAPPTYPYPTPTSVGSDRDALLLAAAAMFGGLLMSGMHSHNIDAVMVECMERARSLRKMIANAVS